MFSDISGGDLDRDRERSTRDAAAVGVLYVEADERRAALTADRLADRTGFEVAVEPCPESALDRLSDAPVDCVVSGYDLPGMTGVELLRAIRADHPDLPVVLFPDGGSESVASDAIAAGVTDYLPWDNDPERHAALADRIEGAVRRYRDGRAAGPATGKPELAGLRDRVVDEAPVGVVVTDARREDNPIVYVNDRFTEVTGYERSDAIGRNCRFLQGEDTSEESVARLREAVATGDRVTVELLNYRKDGEPFWNRVRIAPLRDADGAVTHFVGFQQDVTDRRNDERELRRSQAHFRALTENSSLGVLTVDDESVVQFANDAIEELLGYAPDELVGESLLEIMPERFHEAHRDGVERYLRNGTRELDWTGIELPGRHRDGHEVHLDISFGEVRIDDEHRFTAVVRDISERKAWERERQEALDLFRSLYDVTTDADLDFEDKVDLLLELGCEKLGLEYGFLTRIEADEGAGGGIQQIIRSHGDHEQLQPGERCPLDEAYCRETIDTDGLLAIADAVESGWESDPAFRRFDLGSYVGGKVVVDGRLYGTFCFASSTRRDEAFTSTDETVVRLMSRWISYELERRRAREEIERQNERLSEFAGILAHDLRNPLNVAEGKVELARESSTGDDHLADATTALERMDALIDDVLALARTGEAVTETERVDLATFVDECWGTVDTAAATLRVETDRAIRADRSRLQQLLENLVRNAVEHGSTSPDSQARQDAVEHGGDGVTITVGDLADGFYVADDGPGIPPEERGDVFGSGYTTAPDGTGFGLAIVSEIVDAHDWDVAVTESESGGARFEITGVEFDG